MAHSVEFDSELVQRVSADQQVHRRPIGFDGPDDGACPTSGITLLLAMAGLRASTRLARCLGVVVDPRRRLLDRVDAGIRLGEKVERDMIVRKVGPDLSMAVVGAPAYLASAEPITVPGDLTRHRCINYRMTGAGTLYAWEFERGGQALSVRVGGPLAFNEPELMLGAALDGLGVAYLLDHEVAPHVASGRLVRLLADWTPPFPGFHVYHSSRRQMRPVLATFLDMLRARR